MVWSVSTYQTSATPRPVVGPVAVVVAVVVLETGISSFLMSLVVRPNDGGKRERGQPRGGNRHGATQSHIWRRRGA